ncbi:MAG: gliding motility-associated C-terminal domain-containing protein [Saprospiraceae bacterium]
MKKTKWLLVSAMCWMVSLSQAQTLQLTLSKESAQAGESVAVKMLAGDNFRRITTLQFSIIWDPNIIDYQGFSAEALQGIAIGNSDADQGIARLSWFAAQGTGIDLAPGAVLMQLKYTAIGQTGDSTKVIIANEPLRIQIAQETDTIGVFNLLDLVQDTGLVKIGTFLNFTPSTTVITCTGNADGAISLNFAGGAEDYTFSWTGPNFSSTEKDIANLDAGDYTVTIKDLTGNTILVETYSITEPDPLELSTFVIKPTTCNQQNGAIAMQMKGGTPPYVYDYGQGPTPDSARNDLSAGTYQITITDDNSCNISATLEVPEEDAPEVNLGGNRTICNGEMVTLSAGQHETYAWSTGANTATINVNSPGTYGVTVTDGQGCEATDAVNISIGPNLQLELVNDFLDVCPGESLELEVEGGLNYQWIDTSGTLSDLSIPNPTAAPLYPTSYTVIGFNACASDTLAIELMVYEVSATAGPDTCIAPGTEAILYATGGISYSWADAPFPVLDPNSARTTAKPEEATTYEVTILDANGCMLVDSLEVLLANDPIESIKRINLITPNNDGKNDILEFKGVEKFGPNKLEIYNRWGSLVYQKVNYQLDDERFDGTKNGKKLPAGNYYYVLAFTSGDVKQKLMIVRD